MSRAPDGEMVADKGSMPTVYVVALPNNFWAKQRLYYNVMGVFYRNGKPIDDIRQSNLRKMMYVYDAITKTERPSIQAREKETNFF